ncbi:caspase family protein [Chryseobacterium viscerum]|uniref:Uncharacterized protein n=1 Tax=Chryseobacterium viscerum TaxID=1037377 RepID=A0A316WCE9_9FLAO|nr:caspase family protein [Chryseobacterium viscerum]PWN58033.1 hypothetical protein C1634_024705 [Chryseobacterium viscerum]
MSKRNLYATLIGINNYRAVNKLNGCIQDILNIDDILRKVCTSQNDDLNYMPLYLLAPNENDHSIAEHGHNIQYSEPSFENITDIGFNHLAQAGEKDICLFYFSGHGSTIASPPEFKDYKGNPQNETLVCVDSRTSGARDILDIELAYLLSNALKDKPDVHCLVIMDCCHSADNTRSLEAAFDVMMVQNRQAPQSTYIVKFKECIGSDTDFFSLKGDKVSYKPARYVQLSACRDHEQSRDNPQGGLFSRKLVELLQNEGTALSYSNLMKSVAAAVSVANAAQNPVADATNPKDLNQPFLGGDMTPYRASFKVYFDHQKKQWELMAGLLNGITGPNNNQKTIIKIEGTDVEAEVSQAGMKTSFLQGSDLDQLDPAKLYKAQIISLALKKKRIGVSQKIRSNDTILDSLKNAASQNLLYVELITDSSEDIDYLVNIYEKGGIFYYYLSEIQQDIPIFKAESSADIFWNNTDSVAKWYFVKKLENGATRCKASDFIFTVEKIEGQNITRQNAKNIAGTASDVPPENPIEFSYRNNHAPAFRFSIRIHSKSALKECYIHSIYLDSLFGIDTKKTRQAINHLTKDGVIRLISSDNGDEYDLTGLFIDPDYASYGINEITDYLKIVVSSHPDINLDHFDQPSLQLDELEALAFRDVANEEELFKGAGSPFAQKPPEADWAVFNFPIRIIGPNKSKILKAGTPAAFDAFEISAPDNFEGFVTAVSGSDIQTSRSIKDLYGSSIWGEALTDSTPFESGLGSDNNSIIALEISGEHTFSQLEEGNPLKIKLTPSVQSRSIDEYDSTIIPYGFDEESGLFYPVGYMNNEEEIIIEQLPKATSGSLVSEAITSRSIYSSIKLYFKKLFRLSTETLTLHYFENGWNSTSNVNIIKEKLRPLSPEATLPLIIHGIFGDTRSMIESLKADKRIGNDLKMMLSFDYENLENTIPEIAKKLAFQLNTIGLPDQSMPKLTVVAHSMGGLVTRQFICENGGADMLSKFIMAGTPNGGSEWGKASGLIVQSLQLLLTHALNVTGPVKWAITGLSFLIKNFYNPGNTLKDMTIASQFLNDLSSKTFPASLPFYIVGSNTELVDNDYATDDPFLKKLPQILKTGALYPALTKVLFKGHPNDMAVTLESMKKIKEFNNNMTIFPGDHISYFSEKQTRDAIIDLICKN